MNSKVIIGFIAGGIINLITFVSLLLYIRKKLTLDALEIIILFTKFEFILYFFSITIYLGVHKFSGTGFKLTNNAFLSYGVVILSIINYCSFRQAFYNKLRIKSLLVPPTSTLWRIILKPFLIFVYFKEDDLRAICILSIAVLTMIKIIFRKWKIIKRYL